MATDGSPCGRVAVRLGADVASRFGARIVLLHVAEHSAGRFGVQGLGDDRADYEAEVWDPVLRNAAAVFRDSEVPFDSLFLEGHPARMILDAADDSAADMIVIGQRGDGHFGKALLGSVADKIAHHSRRPVLLAPCPHDEGDAPQ